MSGIYRPWMDRGIEECGIIDNMKRLMFFAFCAATALCGCVESAASGFSSRVAITGLEVNRLECPGNVRAPVFSWKMETSRAGARQVAYRIVVSEAGKSGAKVVWDSGEVKSDVSVGIAYAGKKLKSAAKYSWRVSVLDENGEWTTSESRFGTGLLSDSDWIGTEWIAVQDPSPEVTKVMAKENLAVPGTSCFLKKINIGKDVVEAMWTVTGQGVFEAYVNGVRAGDDFLKPGFTHVLKTRHAFTYDVTPLLSGTGADVFSAEVSSGWWRDKIVGYRGRESAFRAQLVIRYADGSEKRFGTDATWFGAIAGRIRRASIFEGEEYDARVADCWKTSASCNGFKSVRIVSEFKGEILPMEGPTVRLREDLSLSPVKAYVWKEVEGADTNRFGRVVKLRSYAKNEAIKLNPGERLVVDFAQNSSAVPKFVLKAKAGTVVTFLPAEMLNDESGLKSRGNDGPEGSIYRKNLRTIANTGAKAIYIASGKGEETYMPRFSFFGYRYASIETTAPVTILKLESVPVTSISKSLERGCLTTGVSDVNRLISNILWGQYSNYLSVPTDCPQRNERLGWTADTQVFCAAASCNADVYGFLSKWMRDMRDSQHEDGSFPGVAPLAQYGNTPHELGWADAGVIVPYTMWRRYGDATILKENWDAMVKFVDAVSRVRYTNAESCQRHQWADWLSYEPYETNSGKANGRGLQGAAQKEAVRLSRQYWKYLGGCYWLWDARMMSEMAAALGRESEAAKYEAMAKEALAYVRKEFLQKDGMLPQFLRGLQTPALFALRFGILDSPEAIAATKDGLMKNIKDHGDCLQTGFLGTSILMDTLTYDAGAPDVAYTLLLQHKNPSWLYSVDQGATTIWERWNSYVKATGFGSAGMNSFNHYAYGAVLSWMYGTMAGIREGSSGKGFKEFVLAPLPDRRVGKVDASFDSPYGMIRSAWNYGKDGSWTWNFTIPPNTTAIVVVPGCKSETLGPGMYTRKIVQML